MLLSLVFFFNEKMSVCKCFFFFQAEDGIRAKLVTGVQTCALPICCTWPSCRPLQSNATGRVAARWDTAETGAAVPQATAAAQHAARMTPATLLMISTYPISAREDHPVQIDAWRPVRVAADVPSLSSHRSDGPSTRWCGVRRGPGRGRGSGWRPGRLWPG